MMHAKRWCLRPLRCLGLRRLHQRWLRWHFLSGGSQRIFILHKNQLYLYDRTTQTWQDFPYHLVAKHLMKEHQFSLSQGYLGVYTQDNGLAFLHLDTRNIRNVSFDIEQKDLVQAVWINEDYFILIYEDKKN